MAGGDPYVIARELKSRAHRVLFRPSFFRMTSLAGPSALLPGAGEECLAPRYPV